MLRTNKVILECFRDENTGELGLALADMPRDETTNAATEGLLIAHDLLEHMNGAEQIGTITDELEALGAIWYVRGQHGELRRDGAGSAYTIEQNVASDLTRMFRDFFHGAHVDLTRLRTRPTEADDSFRQIIAHAVEGSPAELDSDEAHTPEARRRLREYIAVCLPRMRIGYRKAARKYERHGRYFANSLFWEVSRAVEPHAKHCETEGQQFELVYGIDKDGRAFARCDEHYPEEY